MVPIYTGLAAWNLLVLAGFGVLSVFQALGDGLTPAAYNLAGVFAAVFGCVVQTLLIAHFVGSMKWIQQSGPTAGVADTRPLRTAWIKGRMFPVLVLAMLAGVAMGIASGACETGGGARWLPTALAALALGLSALGLPLARRELVRQKGRMQEMRARMEVRLRAGEVPAEPAAELLPQSRRAAAQVLLFLAANVWLLYAYVRFVLREPDPALGPYALASAVLLALGLLMRRTVPAPPR